MTIRDAGILDDVLLHLQRIWVSPETAGRFEFELRRLEKIIKAFFISDPVRSYYLLGLSATLRDDATAMRARFTNALRHDCQDVDVRRGYAACLARLRFFSEAREQYEIVFFQNEEDLGVLAELIITSLATGRIQDGVRWMHRWSTLNPHRPFEEAGLIAKNSALLEKHGISDDHVERLQRLALSILDRERRDIKTIHYHGVPQDDPEWIVANFVIDETADVVNDLNGKLSSAITHTATPSNVSDILKFGYSADHRVHP